MNDKKLDRFQHLERERSEALEEKVTPVAMDRFGVVERAQAPAPVPAGAGVDRFGKPTGPEEVLVEANTLDEQPFVKCAGCGTEAGKFVQRCAVCGADFDTAEQREFNARVWAERKAQLQAERDAEHAKQAQLLDEAAHRHDAKRAMGEAIAREIRENADHRATVDALSGRDRVQYGGSSSGRSPLVALLSRLPSPWGFAVGGVLFMVPLGILKWSESPRLHGAAGIWLILDILFLLPPSFWLTRRSGTWWNDW